MKKKEDRIVILGAGVTGLSAAHRLSYSLGNKDIVIIEKENCVGGTARTLRNGGFQFDLTGHALHLNNKKIKRFILNDLQLAKELLLVKRKAAIFLKGRFIPYPFQYHLAFLDKKTRDYCLNTFLSANKCKNQSKVDSIENEQDISFKEYSYAMFGEGISDLFLIPYNEKLWSFDLNQLSTGWLKNFFPKPDVSRILSGARYKKINEYGYNTTFFYPKKGGIQRLSEKIAKHIENKILLNHTIEKIDLYNKSVEGDNFEISYDKLISTIPLPLFLKYTNQENFKQKLKWTIIRAFFISVPKNRSPKYSWLYLPDPEIDAYRMGNFSMFSKSLRIKNKDLLWIECSKSNLEMRNLPTIDDIISQLHETSLLNREEIDHIATIDINPAYVIYDKNHNIILNKIAEWLTNYDLKLAGRYGSWQYISMEQCIKDGFRVADEL